MTTSTKTRKTSKTSKTSKTTRKDSNVLGVYENLDGSMDAPVLRVVKPGQVSKAKKARKGNSKLGRDCTITIVGDTTSPYKANSNRDRCYQAIIHSSTVGEAYEKCSGMKAKYFRMAIDKGIIDLEGEYSF